jgi:hypothetical protein
MSDPCCPRGELGEKGEMSDDYNRNRPLEAEIERLRGELSYMTDEVAPALYSQIERLHAERDEWKTLNSQRVDEIERLRGIVAEILTAWGALPEGNHPPRRVERWLREDMHPAINRGRAALAAIARSPINEQHVINERNDA